MLLSCTLLQYLAHPLQYRLFSKLRCCLPANRCSHSLLLPLKEDGIVTQRVSDAAAAQRLTVRKKIGETGICACLSSTAVVKPLTEYMQVTVL